MSSVEKQIGNISELVSSTMVAVRACKSRSATVQLLRDASEGLGNAVEYFKHAQKRVFIDTRKSTQILCNAFSSIADGVESGDITRPELSTSFEYVEKHLKGFRSASAADIETELNKVVAAKAELTEKQKDVSATLSSSAAKKAAKVAETGDRKAVALPAEVPEALKQFASFKDELPTRIDSAYELVRLPVVPIFSEAQHLNSKFNLDKIGIKGIALEGYTILDRQTVLLFSRREAKKHDLTPIEYANTALEAINEHLSTKLSVVTDSFIASPKNADHLLFWLMPSARIAALFKAAGSKSGTVRWGLPF